MNQIPWENIQKRILNPDHSKDENLDKWMNENEGNKEIVEELKLTYSLTGDIPDSFIPQKDKAWQKVEKRVSANRNRIELHRFLLRVAASFLLIFLGISATLLVAKLNTTETYSEVYSPYGHKTKVILPDQSEVWLNGNSKIKYLADFKESRNVELTGEAFFKVKKDDSKQFVVQSKDLDIAVSGTSFNVKAYDDDKTSEVVLVEGSIEVLQKDHLLKKMKPGEILSFDTQQNKFQVSNGRINHILSWKEGELIIENERLEDVVKYLERWYGVKITLDNSVNKDQRLSFKVKAESLRELLVTFKYIIPVTYTIDGKEVRIMKES